VHVGSTAETALLVRGYYQTPRRVNVQTIADRAGVPRTTLQEHLNKAENKLIASIVPQIQLYARKNRVTWRKADSKVPPVSVA
jgi:hypothetical protein